MQDLFGLGPHAGFIVACYAMTVVVVAGLIGWVLVDHRRQAARLAEMETRGIRRRSARAAATARVDAPEAGR